MPQSYTGLYYHIIFSTKNRRPLIASDIAPRLYEYIGGIVRNNDGALIAAGGTEDHIHLLAILSRQQSVSDALRIIKTNSSSWIHKALTVEHPFAWQHGYGAFTVSASVVDRVKHYIANQHEHHRTMTFQKEFLRFLREYNVPYDKRYVWE
ncbi:MAG: IS200/IS605 family transposase [Bacteroidetes bacterium]|nr:IS200/IS605 family transposase [Bacteroidota bacterium]